MLTSMVARLARSHDPVTGLLDRSFFESYVRGCAARAERHPARGFAVLVVKIRDLGRLRRWLGGMATDEAISDFAERVVAAVRPIDVVTRLGDDTFGIVVDDVAGAPEAAVVAERVRAICEVVTLTSVTVGIDTSVDARVFDASARGPGP
jgi:diguanylate cyclase (GGDEF)-like protein